MVHNHIEINEEYDFHPVSECDTETLALLIEDGDGTLIERTSDAITQADGALAIAALWNRPQRLVLARRGNPLCISESKGGSLYFASRPDALPGRPRALTDNRAQLFTFGKDHTNGFRRVQKADLQPTDSVPMHF